MSIKQELELKEKERAAVIEKHTQLLSDLIVKYEIPIHLILSINNEFFEYGSVCQKITRLYTSETEERISNILTQTFN